MRHAWVKWNEALGRLPILQARFVLWGISFLVTTYEVTIVHWVPSLDWLIFLAALAGVDLSHFYFKRVTDTDHVTAVKAAEGGTPEPEAK